MNGFFLPDLHFINAEFENSTNAWNATVEGYLGFGYIQAQPEVRVSTSF
jgi:hypothetical protein